MTGLASLRFLGVFLLLVGTLAGAQSDRPRTLRYDKPFKTALIDLDTGTVIRGPTDRLSASASEFRNMDLGGFVGADTGQGFCRWFDAGVKGSSGNASDLMTGIIFSYCSAALDVISGGPGGTATLKFYEGYTSGGGAMTTQVAVLTMSGLPANSAHATPFPGFGRHQVTVPTVGMDCWIVGAVFSPLVPFADGPIGYSWLFKDTQAGNMIAATVPYLGCISSCSGPGPDGQGMVDQLDRYFPPTTLQSTFSFNTTPFGSYFTSMSMEIFEAEDCTGTAIVYNSSPANVDVLSSTPVIVGTTYIGEVTHAPGTATFSVLMVRGASANLNGGISPGCGQPRGRVLVQNPFIVNLTGTPDAIAPISATQRNFTASVPLLLELTCQTWYAQAFTLGASCQKLSNGIQYATGTH